MKKLNGRRIPESRVDEIRLSADELNKLNDQTNGMIDPNIVTTAMLSEINTSVAILVDIASNILNRLVASEKNANGEPSGGFGSGIHIETGLTNSPSASR